MWVKEVRKLSRGHAQHEAASAHAGLDGDGLVQREGRAATVGASMVWGLRAPQEVGRLGDCGC